jgi:hypothetical protein
MTIEEQLSKEIEEREEARLRNIKATTLFFAQAEERLGMPCSDLLWVGEPNDDRWSPEAQEVLKFVVANDNLSDTADNSSYRELQSLVEKVSSSDEIYALGDLVLWMVGLNLLSDSEEECDHLMERAEKCDDCREVIALWTKQFLVMDYVLPPAAISALVHSGFAQDYHNQIWCDLEGLADGMSHDPGPWKEKIRATGCETYEELLEWGRTNPKKVAA